MPENLQINFSSVDVTARQDIQDITANSMVSWSVLDDFRFENRPHPPFFPTNEPNFSVSGEWEEISDNIVDTTVGFFSDIISDENGDYPIAPTLTFSFNDPHRSPALTVWTYSDCDYDVRVSWYSDTLGTNLIATGEHTIGISENIITQSVINWRFIKFEFLRSSIPKRFVKMWGLDFGVVRVIYDVEISACRILERIDPTVEILSVNTVRSKIRSRNSLFSPITSPNFDGMMMKYQPFTVLRSGELFGLFFLDKWTDPFQSAIEFDITGIDAVGVMDKHEHVGGMYVNTPVRNILDEIFEIPFPTKLVTYVLDPEYENELISGWVPYGTCGLTLQHVCFALNATADTSRTGYVQIYPREEPVLEDVTIQSSDVQPFVRLSNLKGLHSPFYYQTNEPNYQRGDDTLFEIPDNVDELNLGWCSLSMSDGSGVFANPPVVDFSFGTSRFFEAMSFNFGTYDNEYIKRMRVTWRNQFNEVVHQQVFEFDSNNGEIEASVSAYRFMRLEILETSQPFRFAKIYSPYFGKSFYIRRIEQFRRGRDEPTAFVSGVAVTSHTFSRHDEVLEVFRDTLPLGRSRPIIWGEPLHGLAVVGGHVIVDSGANYAIIDVRTANEVVITGRRYTWNRQIHESFGDRESGHTENVVTYENYTLVSSNRGDIVAQKIFGFLRQPIEITREIRLLNREIGYLAQTETRGRDVLGVITQLDVNLRAGKAMMRQRGNVI